MKTSLTDTIRTERFLRRELPAEENTAFESRLRTDTGLQEAVFFHRMVHRLILLYRRKKIKSGMKRIHERLLHDPMRVRYRKSIYEIFNP